MFFSFNAVAGLTTNKTQLLHFISSYLYIQSLCILSCLLLTLSYVYYYMRTREEISKIISAQLQSVGEKEKGAVNHVGMVKHCYNIPMWCKFRNGTKECRYIRIYTGSTMTPRGSDKWIGNNGAVDGTLVRISDRPQLENWRRRCGRLCMNDGACTTSRGAPSRLCRLVTTYLPW